MGTSLGQLLMSATTIFCFFFLFSTHMNFPTKISWCFCKHLPLAIKAYRGIFWSMHWFQLVWPATPESRFGYHICQSYGIGSHRCFDLHASSKIILWKGIQNILIGIYQNYLTKSTHWIEATFQHITSPDVFGHTSILQQKLFSDSFPLFWIACWCMQLSTGLLCHHRVPVWGFFEGFLTQVGA